MNLKTKYFLFIGIVHGLLLVLSFSLLKENKILFIPAEIGILLSLYFSYRIYRAFLKPLRLMQQGIDAIKDEDFNISFSPSSSKEMDQLIEVYNRMIHKIRKERISQKEQHYFLEKLIDVSPNGIIILDFNDKITSINRSAKKALGLQEEELKLPVHKIKSDFLQQIHALEEDSSAIISVDGWKKYKCHSANFIHRGFERKFLLIEELSNEILQTEKKAYGKVIRMMAHEVNNSLGAVNSILQSTRNYFPAEKDSDNQWVNALQVAEARNDRLRTFMKNFADVIRLPEANREEMDLNEILQNMAAFFKLQAYEKKVEFHFDFKSDHCPIIGDRAQLEQVLINIIKNAFEAMAQGGIIKFHTEEKSLLISNNGEAIDLEIEKHLFQPFYSSKPDGQGIGLTLIKEVLQAHEAEFSLKSYADGWTKFKIDFKH